MNGPLPLEWQLNAVERINHIHDRSRPIGRHVPAAVPEGKPYGRE